MADLGIPAWRLHRLVPWRGQGQPQWQSENAPCRRWQQRAWGVAWKLHKARPGGVSVNRPSWRTGEPPASRTARFRTTCRSKPGR